MTNSYPPIQAPAFLMKLSDLLENFEDGDQHGWWREIRYLWQHHNAQMAELVRNIVRANDIIREPILLGDDGRVWDGHHRIAAAVALQLVYVPVIRSSDLTSMEGTKDE